MATAVISGRVEEELKERVGRLIQAAGMSAADVIKTVWENIARTGEVPMPCAADEQVDERAKRFAQFMELRASLPACPELIGMDDDAMRSVVAERYEAGFNAGGVSADNAARFSGSSDAPR